MAGIPINKDIVNQRAGYLVKTLRDTLAEITRTKLILDGLGDEGMIALGFTQTEADLIQAAFFDLDKVRQVANGQAEQVGANDFFWNAKHLTGIE